MSRGIAVFGILFFGFAGAVSASAESPVSTDTAEERFFRDCAQPRYISVHDEARLWDLHTLLYTGLSVSEVEVFRLVDWLVDLPWPGEPLRPMERATQAIRHGFSRLPPWTPVVRAGQLADALQLPELSLGDASATYQLAGGGTAGPGSGVVVRINKLVDWLQRVTGDANWLLGAPFGRRRGLIRFSAAGRGVDGLQNGFTRGFHRASIFVARGLDKGLSAVEITTESIINIGYRQPHREDTVFLRMPVEVFRAHELWFLKHHRRLVVDLPESFAQSTHAVMAHRRDAGFAGWPQIDRLTQPASPVVVMTARRLLKRAPKQLQSYVVPAIWVLEFGDNRIIPGDIDFPAGSV